MRTLFEAVEAQDAQALDQAIEAASDLSPLGPGKTTPLIEAARRGWLAGVDRLLEAGAEAAWRDEAEETALLKAAANGHRAVAQRLEGLATEDERDLARAFLAAFGSVSAPEYEYDESRLKHKAVGLAARAASVLGHEEPSRRVERVDRAQANRRKR